jgi:phosphate transport system substrate-binding protein
VALPLLQAAVVAPGWVTNEAFLAGYGVAQAVPGPLSHSPQPGSAEVVQSVASAGLGYKTEGVRTVPLAAFYGTKCYDTTAEATYSGKYPIARYLYIYLNKKPDEPLDPLRAEFIKYILSKDGQTLTEKNGYFQITNEIRQHDLDALGISTLAN